MADGKGGLFATAPPLESAAGLEVTELKAEEIQVKVQDRWHLGNAIVESPQQRRRRFFWKSTFFLCTKIDPRRQHILYFFCQRLAEGFSLLSSISL